jgi:hypothetical protein
MEKCAFSYSFTFLCVVLTLHQGAPVDLRPMADDPALGADPNQNNNFDYSHVGFSLFDDEKHCPFAAHTRFAYCIWSSIERY